MNSPELLSARHLSRFGADGAASLEPTQDDKFGGRESSAEATRRSGERLRSIWLGRLSYDESLDLQQTLFDAYGNYLLLVEHDHVFTMGRSASPSNLLDVDDELVRRVNRGGDVTYHGPGQIVGYPVLTLPTKRGGGMTDTVRYVRSVERALIDVLGELGLQAYSRPRYPGVWLGADGETPRKVAAIGVRLSRARSMHGFALNQKVDLSQFERILPCGITDGSVTSLQAENVDVSRYELLHMIEDSIARNVVPGMDLRRCHYPKASASLLPGSFDRTADGADDSSPELQGATPASVEESAVDEALDERPFEGVPVRLRGRLAASGVDSGLTVRERKPSWMRVKLDTGENYLRLKNLSRSLGLATVCEEAKCPNIFECWNEGTATFMLLGERCTRSCAFCNVETAMPNPPEDSEPRSVADAVASLKLEFAVLTMVARDDLDDGGASIVAESIRQIRASSPDTGVEVLISDLRGSQTDLETVLEAEPDVLNHNIETVARLQRAVRPSASYGRSLALLARSKAWARRLGTDLKVKSGVIVGLGETTAEVHETLSDLASVGVDFVTIGQYLRPTARHMPVSRWWSPDEFDELKHFGETELGLVSVMASPLTRSSHKAGSMAAHAESGTSGEQPESQLLGRDLLG